LAAPRAYCADTLAGYPVLAVRGDDGVLRAFHNVCRHRAAPLVRNEAGVCDGHLTCPYHGWKYTLDGRLRAARDFGAAADFDPRDYGLFPIKVAVWRGLVFVAIGDDPPDLCDLLAPLEARLKGADWSDLKLSARRHHRIDCNWKNYVENYSEGYHVSSIHPTLDAELRSEEYKVTVEGKVVIHTCPTRDETAVYNGLWAWAWPNIGINVYSRGLMIERMSPIGHAGTQLDYFYLMPDGEPIADETMTMSDQVTLEDVWITQGVQKNLNAGVYQTGRLSPKHETAVAAFQNWVRAHLA
jgi:choline monooxygenase